MKIKRIFRRNDKRLETELSWTHDEKSVVLKLDFDAHAVFSKPLQLVLLEGAAIGKIFSYTLDGKQISAYPIQKKDGYEFRGLNKNIQSRTGVSLLYHPKSPGLGNAWQDTEQFEFVLAEDNLGKFLDIYR